MAAGRTVLQSITADAGQQFRRLYVWEWPIRLTHWANAISIPVLMATGLFIASPQLTPMGEAAEHFWMGRFREVHFVAGYVLIFSLIVRAYWFFAGNNYARSGFPFFWKPSWWKALWEQVAEYMQTDRGHVHIGHNSLAGAAYVSFFALCVFEAVTGMALYSESNPGGFWDRLTGWTVPLLGGSFRTHMWHHLAAWCITAFAIIHVYIVLYDTFLFRNALVDSILSGYKFAEKGDHDCDRWVS